MKFGVPWSVKGIRPEARETAKEAARRSGMSLDEWLNSIILQQAATDGVQTSSRVSAGGNFDGDNLAAVHQRLDDLSQRIEHFTRTGPAAYAPKHSRDDEQIAGLIGRLDRRLDQFANTSPPIGPSIMPPAMPTMRLPPALDRAVAEINARQRALNGQPLGGPAAAPQLPQNSMAAHSPVVAPMPAQDLSGLEDQLRNITNQIETLRNPGVEAAINALRAELGEIGRALTDAMPRQAIDAIEKQIHALTQRIAEGRQAGVDNSALSGIEHGLAEVRDALRGLMPAENLVGFNEAVAGLAHRIDLIVAQKDPATFQQLEHAITTLRDMANHVASTDAVTGLATQVQMLAEKVEHMAAAGDGSDALNNLEHRIAALSDSLAERAQGGNNVPPRLETLVQSLSEKIEQIQQSRGDNIAVGHLEDRIAKLVERLDASDSRFSHLEAIERGLADLLVHIEDMRGSKQSGALRAESSPGLDALKNDIARTQDALEAVNGTLGHVVDRLVIIEKGIRGEAHPRTGPDSEFAGPTQAAGKVAVRTVIDAPPLAPPAAAPRQAGSVPPAPNHLPPAVRMPINPDLPPDQPIEPGSGPPSSRANPSARIAASEAAFEGAPPAPAAASGGKSDFIAAARRAAQAAAQTPSSRTARAKSVEAGEPKTPSLRAKVMKRVKSLFIAASIVAVVVGSVQIASNFYEFDKLLNPRVTTAKGPDTRTGNRDAAAPSAEPEAPTSLAADVPEASQPLEPPKLPGIASIAPLTGGTIAAITPPLDLSPTAPTLPSLLNPPLLESKSDVTGSIPRTPDSAGVSRQAAPPQPASPQISDGLPTAIGGPRLRAAAAGGDGAAAYEVAVRFAEGRGVPISLEDAARWFERAASKGVTPAQFRYASLLEKGLGVKKDLIQARRLYLAAAAKGNGKAMHNLAVLYAEGIDGKPDYGTAAQWFRKASERGIADSQYNLGVLCARGLGTEKNIAESYKWFALAAAHGDRESAKKRDEVASLMDARALAAAQQAVTAFVAEPQPEDATAVPEPPGGWDHAVTAPPPQGKSRPAGPLSLTSFEIGKR